jgi:hypothetical protein
LLPDRPSGSRKTAARRAHPFAEKLRRHGKRFGQAVGVLLVAVGVLAIWFPWLLPGLHVAPMPM